MLFRSPEAEYLLDKRPCPPLSQSRPVVMLYADNGNHPALDRHVCDSSRQSLAQALNNKNLATHETVTAVSSSETLGVKFDGYVGLVGATPERDRRLDQTLLHIERGAFMSSSDMQRLVGHITIRLLLRRPLLSILNAVYAFIHAGYVRRRRLRPSVLDELRALRALLIFAHSDLRLPTAATVTMYDACLSGYGVGQSVWKIKEIDAAINHDERWRFREHLDGETHRTRAIRELEEQKALFRCADPLSDSSPFAIFLSRRVRCRRSLFFLTLAQIYWKKMSGNHCLQPL